VAETFKILEHTPVNALDVNFISALKFSESAKGLISRYFCAEPKTMLTAFGEGYLVDSRVRFG
jgi:hypothetical protein